jgi:hypothetical protein
VAEKIVLLLEMDINSPESQHFSDAQNVFFKDVNKHINISYKDRLVTLNVGTCIFWQDFIDLINANVRLSIEKDAVIEGIYHIVQKEKCFVEDLQGLEGGVNYYVETKSTNADNSKGKLIAYM